MRGVPLALEITMKDTCIGSGECARLGFRVNPPRPLGGWLHARAPGCGLVWEATLQWRETTWPLPLVSRRLSALTAS